ncbi:MAG TPA: pseudouridine-5'-phosphate glycosidase [Gemmatimonadaceae bacterium]|nr:pseudouridine-5'-phosphate glycosidase [Gemmatimonadaceae bacterium]
MATHPVRLLPEVDTALGELRPVVALESSVLAQGLPEPANREAAVRMERAIRALGVVPAISAVVRGIPALGLEPDELERFLRRESIRKASARDLPWAIAGGFDAATTVAGTLAIARVAGVRVFATGGIGGVHREPAFDESADLVELSRASVVVVCSGAKSILDLGATWERLETLGVPVIGYRTDELPGFFTAHTGIRLDSVAESAGEVARSFAAQRGLGLPSALLVVQPPPADFALDRAVVDEAVAHALERVRAAGIRGGEVTPFLLEAVERATGGRSCLANLALLERNAGLAAEISVALAERDETTGRGSGARTAAREMRFVSPGG